MAQLRTDQKLGHEGLDKLLEERLHRNLDKFEADLLWATQEIKRLWAYIVKMEAKRSEQFVQAGRDSVQNNDQPPA
jgi:hypothetical protein